MSVQVITTRSYDERLNTIAAVREAGISVCSGGILGLGESDADRVGLIWQVSTYVYAPSFCRQPAHSLPECPSIQSPSPSMPWSPSQAHPWRTTRSAYCLVVNTSHLTPFQPVPFHTILRTIATARVVLPTTIIRLAAGRQTLDESKQAMCFMAGANAVFTGDAMLTTPCKLPDFDVFI